MENGAGIDKILGMCYDFSKDEFFFQIDLVKFLMEVLNKRGALQVIASVFDPLQALSPWTIRARLIFQRIVQIVKGWNDEDRLPQNEIENFAAWQRSGAEIGKFRLRRWTATK